MHNKSLENRRENAGAFPASQLAPLCKEEGDKMEFEYAYNYWRKIFVDGSDGHFNKDDFDKWFRNDAQHVSDAFGYFPTIDNPVRKGGRS